MTENIKTIEKKSKPTTSRKRKIQDKKSEMVDVVSNDSAQNKDVSQAQTDYKDEVKAVLDEQIVDTDNAVIDEPINNEAIENYKEDAKAKKSSTVAYQHLFGYLWNGQAVDY